MVTTLEDVPFECILKIASYLPNDARRWVSPIRANKFLVAMFALNGKDSIWRTLGELLYSKAYIERGAD